MSAVAGSPLELAELASRLSAQAVEHDTLRATLRRALDAVPPTPAGATVLAEAERAATGIGALARSFEELAGFVWGVAEALAAADETLARVGDAGGSGMSPWTALGTPTGSGTTRRYARGARRVYRGTFDGPLRRSDRTRSVSTGSPSVREGWTSAAADVSLVDRTRSARTGASASRRVGGDGAHVDLAASAGVAATVGASVGVGDREARAALHASVEAGVSASASAFAGSGLLGAGASARVFAGARAEGDGRVAVGLRGIDAEITAHVLLGGAADVDAEVDLLGVRTTTRASVSYGLGAEIDADASIGLDRIALALDLGATIGLGVSLGIDVSISPRAVAGGVAGALGDGAGAAGSTFKKLKGLFS